MTDLSVTLSTVLPLAGLAVLVPLGIAGWLYAPAPIPEDKPVTEAEAQHNWNVAYDTKAPNEDALYRVLALASVPDRRNRA